MGFKKEKRHSPEHQNSFLKAAERERKEEKKNSDEGRKAKKSEKLLADKLDEYICFFSRKFGLYLR